jgi:hypothetical protein
MNSKAKREMDLAIAATLAECMAANLRRLEANSEPTEFFIRNVALAALDDLMDLKRRITSLLQSAEET